MSCKDQHNGHHTQDERNNPCELHIANQHHPQAQVGQLLENIGILGLQVARFQAADQVGDGHKAIGVSHIKKRHR